MNGQSKQYDQFGAEKPELPQMTAVELEQRMQMAAGASPMQQTGAGLMVELGQVTDELMDARLTTVVGPLSLPWVVVYKKYTPTLPVTFGSRVFESKEKRSRWMSRLPQLQVVALYGPGAEDL